MAVRQPTIDLPAQRASSDARAGRGWYAVLARTGLVAKGVSYGLVGVLAVALALGAGGQTTSRQGALEELATHSFGKVVLALLALGFAAYAIWRFVQAVAEREDGDAEKWGKRAGLVGHVARAVVFSLIGIFLVKAAVEFDPKDAIGLDGALRKLEDAGYGPYLLGLTAAGLVAYGLYCFVDARYRDVSAG